LAAKSADVVKIATMANNPNDNVRMLSLMATAGVPTVGMCMGDMGTPTRILAGRFGAPFTYATFHHERALAPGQLSYKQMTEIYHYDSINADTEVFGVIADPIGHSLSPVIHNAAFFATGMNRVYVPFRVPKEHLRQFLDDCPGLGIRGLSVTIPHKEAALRLCTRVDKAVAGIGAANTLLFQDDQVIGFCRADDIDPGSRRGRQGDCIWADTAWQQRGGRRSRAGKSTILRRQIQVPGRRMG
jgi:3-dehydroquinate dehydratase/shikimate dehydrogenase